MEVSLQRSGGEHRLFSLLSPLLTPFIKPISILKAVRSPSVQRLVGYLTPCFPHSLVFCSLINPAEGANLASGSSMGRPGFKGAPPPPPSAGWVLACAETDPEREGPGQLQSTHSPPSSPFPGLYKGFWPLCHTACMFLWFSRLGLGGPA